MFRTRFSAADGVVILLVLLLGALPFLAHLIPASDASAGEWLILHTPEGETAYPLSSDREISVTSGGITLTVRIRDGRACVAESTCPDKYCRNTGWISRVGETVICAPASVRLTVTDRKGGDGDADAAIG